MDSRSALHKLPLCLVTGLALAAGSAAAFAADNAPTIAPAAAPALGTIVGLVTNASHAPVAHATVTASLNGGATIRSTLSGNDGTYSFSDLPAGNWSLTVEAEGVANASVSALSVHGNAATRHDVALGGTAEPSLPKLASATAPASAADDASAAPQQGSGHGLLGSLSHAVAYFTLPDSGVKQHPSLIASLDGGAAPDATAAPAPGVPEALQTPDPAPTNDTHTPLANTPDTGWMNGNTRETTPIFDTKFFTPEIRFDTNYIEDLNQPVDHTIVGSTEEFRSSEFQIEQVSFGGNFHWNGVQARFLSMMGLFSTATIRNDASSAVGQWDLPDAYRYLSEANAGYHWDNVGHGLNVDAGIFVSYIGLFSYYNFDNWTYQPSFVSSNTPWFFNGLRIQYWPTQNLKIEPWIINGWQSAAKYNNKPGIGGQVLYVPSDDIKWVFNSYFLGEDNLSSGSGNNNCNTGGTIAAGLCNNDPTYIANSVINYAHVHRVHEDDSFLWRYYHGSDKGMGSGISQAAFSLTWDFGCEYGGAVDGKGGVGCTGGQNKASFLGWMLYNRVWFDHNLFAVTTGGGAMNNPGRYLALMPPVNGATAASGTSYFTENPGQPLYQWDMQLNLQYMPKDWITWWAEVTYRHSNVPYWSGENGVTPFGGNNGSTGSVVCNNGSNAGYVPGGTAAINNSCGMSGAWFPDLRTSETLFGAGVMVKF